MNEQERAEQIVDMDRALDARRAVRALNGSNEEDREVLRIIIEIEGEEQNRSMVIDAAKAVLASEKWPAAYKVECPNCGAKPGDKCTNYRGKEMGEPHSTRKKAGGEQGAKRRKRRDWPKCTAKDCTRNVYMPAGAAKLCYQHYLEAGHAGIGKGCDERAVANLRKYGSPEPPEGKRNAPIKKKDTSGAKKGAPAKGDEKWVNPKLKDPKPDPPKKKRLKAPKGSPDEKTCPKCGTSAKGEDDIQEKFGWRNTKSKRKDGTVVEKRVPQSHCRECRRKKARKA